MVEVTWPDFGLVIGMKLKLWGKSPTVRRFYLKRWVAILSTVLSTSLPPQTATPSDNIKHDPQTSILNRAVDRFFQVTKHKGNQQS
jgi:hypothetical protein